MQTNPKLWLIELLAWWEGKVRPSQYLNWLVGYTPSIENSLATFVLHPPELNITRQFIRPIVQTLRDGGDFPTSVGVFLSGAG